MESVFFLEKQVLFEHKLWNWCGTSFDSEEMFFYLQYKSPHIVTMSYKGMNGFLSALDEMR